MLHPHCHGEDYLNGRLPNDGKSLMQTYFKHGLAAMVPNIESLLLQQASALRETPSGKLWLAWSARSSGVGNGSVRAGPMSGDPENRSESGTEEGEHRQRQPANGIKN